MTQSTHFSIREDGKDQAIIFVHGFSGNAHSTFGMMPAFLAADRRLDDWDFHCFGYSSNLSPDITGLWSSDPNIKQLAGLLSTQVREVWTRPRKLALVAHSMGGLVVQRALLDGGFLERVHSLMLFGTPSGGLLKAGFGRIFKRQVADMDREGPFIRALREDWSRKFPAALPFKFAVVAGNNDQFVPPSSSLEAFDASYHRHVRGNHLEMVKPTERNADSVQLVLNRLVGVETKPPAQALDPSKTISEQALALELQGREEEAIQLLESKRGVGTDVMGTLAGRYKRRWLREVSAGENPTNFGARSRDLYEEALNQAELAGDHPQCAYLAINCAFMVLAINSEEQARPYAERALLHAKQAPYDVWSTATQAEAMLHLRKPAEALATYSLAYEALNARERGSMFQQASWTARLLGETLVDSQLEAIRLEAG